MNDKPSLPEEVTLYAHPVVWSYTPAKKDSLKKWRGRGIHSFRFPWPERADVIKQENCSVKNNIDGTPIGFMDTLDHWYIEIVDEEKAAELHLVIYSEKKELNEEKEIYIPCVKTDSCSE